MEPTRWKGLAPDVAREIAGRLDAAADFVHFHAVCKPWRGSLDAQPRQFPPWLLALDGDNSTPLWFRCIFSKSSYRTQRPRPPFAAARRNWVCKADGAGVRYLTVEKLCPSLHDPLTGQVTQMPPFPYNNFHDRWAKNNGQGIVYGDGTILLYSVSEVGAHGGTASFKAALLRSGDTTKWTLVDRSLRSSGRPDHREFCAAHHDGRILVFAKSSVCLVITLDDDVGVNNGDVILERPCNNWLCHQYNYVLESYGELLWVSIHGRSKSLPVEYSVSVLAFEVEPSSAPKKKMGWVIKDRRSLADRVLFLGSPSSFALDASQLGISGGCAYFGYANMLASYNLIDGKAEFIERLPRGWDDGKCLWFVPQPAISPIQEITKKSLMAPEQEQQKQETTPIIDPTSIIHIIRHHEPCFRVLVRNLPRTMDSSQLEFLFSNHGKVSNAEVVYCKKTSRSRGFGFVTMSTVHAHLDDALDALDGMLCDGHALKVILDEEERPRCRRRKQRFLPS